MRVFGKYFVLEDGDDWKMDNDDGQLYASFLFIAHCEGFQARFSASVHGNAIVTRRVALKHSAGEEQKLDSLEIVSDSLELHYVQPEADDDLD